MLEWIKVAGKSESRPAKGLAKVFMVISLSGREAGWPADCTWALSVPVKSSALRWCFGCYGPIPLSGSTFAYYLIGNQDHFLSPAWESDCLYGALRMKACGLCAELPDLELAAGWKHARGFSPTLPL